MAKKQQQLKPVAPLTKGFLESQEYMDKRDQVQKEINESKLIIDRSVFQKDIAEKQFLKEKKNEWKTIRSAKSVYSNQANTLLHQLATFKRVKLNVTSVAVY